MKTISIKTLTDSYDCDCCGGSFCEGGIVVVDGKEVLRREPVAYCYGAPSFSEGELLVMALKKLGIDVLVDGDRYYICSYDEEYHGVLKGE